MTVCDSCVEIISHGLPNLHRLNLDGVLWITDNGIAHLANGVAVSTGNLHALWLDGFELSSSGISDFLRRIITIEKNLEKNSLSQISGSSHSLSELGIQLLSFSFCDNIGDNEVKLMASLPNLVSLTLRKPYQVSSSGLSSLFSSYESNS